MSRIFWAARLCVVAVVSVVSVSVEAAAVSGQGTWETSLQARAFEGEVVAYYDPFLDITWLKDANFAKTSGFDANGLMNFDEANAWASGLTLFGGNDWRLPTLTPVNDTLRGYANTGVGWGAASEMGYMFYVHLGNIPGGSWTTAFENSGPFPAIYSVGTYWTNQPFDSLDAWYFNFQDGLQTYLEVRPSQFFQSSRILFLGAWAVHPGDLIGPLGAPVPLPGGLWLLGSALLGVGARARRR